MDSSNFKSEVEQKLKTAKYNIKSAKNLQELNATRVNWLGKNGWFTIALKRLSDLSAEDKPVFGKIINTAKNELVQSIQKHTDKLSVKQLEAQISQEKIDVTLPGRGQNTGGLHPLTKVRDRIEQIFISMGFDIEAGPEIEDEFHNFEALNMPPFHPARTVADTFYLQNIPYLLRTHTSPVQIRVMQKSGVPLKVIAGGRVYRRDSDATHVPMFHQLEGFLVDEHTTFADLKGLLISFMEAFFARKIELRFRPSYFPFTEPSAEVDLQCIICNGKGCNVCKGSGWIEVLGCGMVHPNVFKAVNVDSERYSGFAFGLGIDRFTMFSYKFNDLRMLFENDFSFLEQF